MFSLLKCVCLGWPCVFLNLCMTICAPVYFCLRVAIVVLYAFICVLTCTVYIARWTDGRCMGVINRDLNPVLLIASTNPTNTSRPAGSSSALRSTHVCVGTNTHLNRCVIQIQGQIAAQRSASFFFKS